jgi:hydroxymethylbilane synthase
VPPSELRVGTRGSQLALWQAHTVAAMIAQRGGPPCQIVVIRTSGDRLQEAPLSQVGGKRLFVKEIEDALLRNVIDLAVHSSKDMPTQLPPGLVIGSALPREDPLDAVVLPQGRQVNAETSDGYRRPDTVRSLERLVAQLGQSPSIGTGSVRRVAQLSRLFTGARFAPIRGNLDTRLRKLDDGDHDALVLASAGLRRLGFAERISFALPASVCVPAPGQGIVAVEIRDGDRAVLDIVRQTSDAEAAAALEAERALVEALGGGCQTPIGALAIPEGDHIDLMAVVIAIDGSRAVRASGRGLRHEARALGARVAADLVGQGAQDILAQIGGTQAAVDGLQP